MKLEDVNENQHRFYAYQDLADIDGADAIVFFSVDPNTPVVRGSRHVEFGYALRAHKSILVVGPAENVFHYIQTVRNVDTWEDAKALLAAGVI